VVMANEQPKAWPNNHSDINNMRTIKELPPTKEMIIDGRWIERNALGEKKNYADYTKGEKFKKNVLDNVGQELTR
jgi:hypothetical protein